MAGLDENAPRPIEAEVAVPHREAVPNAVGGTEDAAARNGHLAIQRYGEGFAELAGAFEAGVQVLLGEECPLVFENCARGLDGDGLRVGQPFARVEHEFQWITGLDVHVAFGQHAQFLAL